MRISLVSRRASCPRSHQNRRNHVLGEPSVRRDQAVSATETVTLVLGEDSPLPEIVADVEGARPAVSRARQPARSPDVISKSAPPAPCE
jgi:hypothetical protein